jgi:hypothetical protein
MQHLVIEGCVDIMDHLICNDTVEEVTRDGKHVRCVTSSTRSHETNNHNSIL